MRTHDILQTHDPPDPRPNQCIVKLKVVTRNPFFTSATNRFACRGLRSCRMYTLVFGTRCSAFAGLIRSRIIRLRRPHLQHQNFSNNQHLRRLPDAWNRERKLQTVTAILARSLGQVPIVMIEGTREFTSPQAGATYKATIQS